MVADQTTQADFTVAANNIDEQVMSNNIVIPPQMQPVYTDFIKHSYLMNTGQWTNVSASFGTISDDIMNTFLTGTAGLAIGNKLKNFRYFTSDIKVTIMVQGFSLAYGKMVFYFDPRPRDIKDDNTSNFPVNTMHALPQKCRCMYLPNIQVDPSKTQIYEITLKCPTTWGVYSLDQRTGSYSMGYQIINPLSSGQAAAPPNITYSIYMSLTNPEMSVLTFTSKTLTGSEQTKLSTHVKSFSEGMSRMGNIPVIGSYATLASTVSQGISTALSWFGFSKPVVQNKMNMGMFYTMDEQGVLDGKVHAHVAGNRFDNSVTISPDSIPLCSFKDQEVEHLANQVGYISTINITTAMASGTLIDFIPIHPQLVYTTDSPAIDDGYEMHNLCLLTRPFSKFKCDFKIRLEFIASVFHRATIVAAYFPDYVDTGVSMANAVQTVKTWQFQIAGNAVYDLEIPYSQPDPYLSTFYPLGTIPGRPGATNGTLVFYVLNPNISNGTGDIYMNIYMGGCNLSMGIASNDNLSTMNYYMTSAPAPSNLVNPLCIPDPHFYTNFFGEEAPHTTKEWAGRMVHYMDIFTPSSLTRTSYFYRVSIPAVPPAGYNTTNIPVLSGVLPIRSGFQLLVGSYLGYKGSTNIAVYPDSYTGGSHNVLFAKANYTEEATVGFHELTDLFSNTQQKTISTMYSALQNFFSVKVPYYYRGYFRPSFPIETDVDARHFLDVEVASSSLNNENVGMTIYAGAGDDFNFVFFRGSPVVIAP